MPSSAAEFVPFGAKETGLESEAVYAHAFRGYQFREVDFDLEAHHYQKSHGSSQPSSSAMLRMAQEQASLVSSLPLSLSSTVFVAVAEDRADFLRAIIFGPEDTPYASGAFLFDIAFPPNYPTTNPKVNLMTTGGGSVRFNPNLYNCGKVCLSLLGTWSGAEGENWNPDTSTFLQVLISIQSLILVPRPYFNEPGYERTMGTPEGERQSNEYSRQRMVATIQWAMVDMIQNPPPGFAEIIHAHFYLKQHIILATVEGWYADAQEAGSSFATPLRKQIDRLAPLLAGLTMPDLSVLDEDSDSDDE